LFRNDQCAIKLWNNETLVDPSALELLRQEAAIGAKVKHPHIEKLRAASMVEQPYFLVFDYLPGESLRERLSRDYAIAWPTAVWIARQIAQALGALSAADCVHADVKPENIRLIDVGTAVLVDLGFAHRVGACEALHADGFVMGTPNYLAPELADLTVRDERRCDIFSLGVTLFEMLTGELPYALGTPQETLLRHRDIPAADLADYRGQWPTRLVALLRRMMARDPERRPHPTPLVAELVALEMQGITRREIA